MAVLQFFRQILNLSYQQMLVYMDRQLVFQHIQLSLCLILMSATMLTAT